MEVKGGGMDDFIVSPSPSPFPLDDWILDFGLGFGISRNYNHVHVPPLCRNVDQPFHLDHGEVFLPST